MKKLSILLLALLLVFSLALSSCTSTVTPPPADDDDGENNNGGNDDVGVKNPISVDHLDLGADFNSDYYPVKNQITQQQGKIDVVILFDGTEKGWQAMAEEYERLHDGSVVVNLNTTYASSTYPEALKYQVTDRNTDWDIIQGNLVNGSDLQQYCINMYTSITGNNGYAGNKKWSTVIERDAYVTDKSGTSTATYIMNSENLLTAFFVNAVALEAAGEKGYRNANGEVGNPVTWNDLISLCDYMQQAGYESPLGISLDGSSIDAYNFSWLLRVYGDYYFRNEYDGIMNNNNYEYDPTLENPENDLSFAIDFTWLMHKILDDSESNCGGSHYVGPKSDKFNDFITNIAKMSPYLAGGATESMEDLRNEFQTQSNGKKSPQIVLDYSGMGLSFLSKETADFKVDFFDYPVMESEYVPEGTLVRDVGGNGGYLSIINHDAAQNELNLDFMKFVMSPYGQTIYYNALAQTDFAPKGLTLVKNSLVNVPKEWKEFFQTDKISFTGLADQNEFVRNMVVSHGGQDIRTDKIEFYQNLLIGQGSDKKTVDQFCDAWYSVLSNAWAKYSAAQKWNPNCYKYPGNGTSYGGK